MSEVDALVARGEVSTFDDVDAFLAHLGDPNDQVRTPSGPDYPTRPEYDPDDPPAGEPVEDDPGTDHEPVTEENDHA